jgi:hypothetical protein
VSTTIAWPPGWLAKLRTWFTSVWKFEKPNGTYSSRHALSGMPLLFQ